MIYIISYIVLKSIWVTSYNVAIKTFVDYDMKLNFDGI